MDKLDELIQASKQDAQPNKDFVNQVMQQIDASQSADNSFWHRLWRHKPILAGSLALLVIIAVLGFQFSGLSTNQTKSTSKPITSTSTKPLSSQTAGVQAAANTSDLQSDLNAVSAGLNKGSQNLNNANSTVNDQQNEISVPTS
jgi:hypothetical protein